MTSLHWRKKLKINIIFGSSLQKAAICHQDGLVDVFGCGTPFKLLARSFLWQNKYVILTVVSGGMEYPRVGLLLLGARPVLSLLV